MDTLAFALLLMLTSCVTFEGIRFTYSPEDHTIGFKIDKCAVKKRTSATAENTPTAAELAQEATVALVTAVTGVGTKEETDGEAH